MTPSLPGILGAGDRDDLIRLPLNLRRRDKMSLAGPTYFLSLAVARPDLVTSNAR